MAETKQEPNADLVKQLKQVLAMAEAGSITNAVIVASGPKLYHRTFSVPKVEDMPMMCGEVGIFLTEMHCLVMGGRVQQDQNRAALLHSGGRFNG